MWTPGHGPELRRARPTCGVDDVDEARFNPLCRRARGVEDDSDPSESDTGFDDDDDDDSHSSECDLVENVRQARLNALRRRRDDREEIRRQNETLDRIHRARHAEREMAKELSSMRFEAERRHTLAWGDDAEVRDRERAAERAAEAIGDAMDEEELIASTHRGAGGDGGVARAAEEARAWAAHDEAWAAFEASVRDGARVRTRDVPWPPGHDRGGDGGGGGTLLASLARCELVERGGGGGAGSCRGGSEDKRLAAFRRAFKRASLRWHPDKFEGKFGGALCDDVCGDDDDGMVRTGGTGGTGGAGGNGRGRTGGDARAAHQAQGAVHRAGDQRCVERHRCVSSRVEPSRTGWFSARFGPGNIVSKKRGSPR